MNIHNCSPTMSIKRHSCMGQKDQSYSTEGQFAGSLILQQVKNQVYKSFSSFDEKKPLCYRISYVIVGMYQC